MKTVVVTGGAGFIGSHLTERLLQDGHTVHVVDNLSSGRLDNLSTFKDHPKLQVHLLDVAQDDLSGAFAGVDWVFHLAGLADIVPSIEHPEAYFEANVQGTLAVLQAAKQACVSRLVYAASSSCYGIPAQYPTPESAAIKPEYPYALTKRMGEELTLHWASVYNLPYLSLRLFNVYGPRARTGGTYGAVFGVFLAQKLANNAMTVVGDGTQTRDFTFVTDIANAFICAAASKHSGQAYNVGSGGTYSINHLVELLGGTPEYIPKRPGEPDITFADTHSIQRDLNWQAKIPFDAGVKMMLSHIDDWKQAPIWNPESISDATRSWFKYLGNETHPNAPS